MTEPDPNQAAEPDWKAVTFSVARQRDRAQQMAYDLEIAIDQAQKRLGDLEAENAALKARLEDVEAAAKPADAKPKAKGKEGDADGDL